jgi:uncharacterized protein YbbC (DUF1343 family)/CubicO group peptidase (beta-lactamase class C family)
VSKAIEAAIAEKKLPGAVVVVGHGGRVVFEQAYGVRKLAGEPGLDGRPSGAEPMTVDTIFDMASLTKCLVTATAVMQLYEAGKIASFDDRVAKYLPEFAANGKQDVTVRELLTHYSGLPPDVDLRDAWGLAGPDKAEGIRRAMNATPSATPGSHFEYSDINYIVLGALVEKLSGETLDIYARRHIFAPLQIPSTRFLPTTGCEVPPAYGSPDWSATWTPGGPLPPGSNFFCSPTAPLANFAPTEHDADGTPATNPDFDHLLRGTVEDPTTRRMGGVAGEAGVFSTAEDVARFAQALLDRLAGRPSEFPLKRETLELMTTPEQPATALRGATIFTQDGKITTPDGTAMTGVAQRGFGWDINSAYSRPRGEVFPTVGGAGPASFGHTGYTGTSVWMDPGSDTYVVLLANSVHPRGNASISPLRGEVATEAARALGVGTQYVDCRTQLCSISVVDSLGVAATQGSEARAGEAASAAALPTHRDEAAMNGAPRVLTGIDVLEATGFAALKEAAARNGGHLRVGLLTNQTGVDAQGRRTIDLLRGAGGGIELTTLFSPEHGIAGAKDSTEIGDEVDAASGLKVVSLYGATEAARRPKAEDLAKLDAVVIDLQDAGVRFYTYETVVGYFVEAAACERARGRGLQVVVLDRPDPVAGMVQGPVSEGPESYTNYMPLPVRHGMTLGELARYFDGERGAECAAGGAAKEGGPQRLKPPCNCPADGTAEAVPLSKTGDAEHGLTVVPMEGWRRDEFFDETGVRWVNPSPNLRSATEAVLYPGVGMFEAANVSVGRGTGTPFEVFGAGMAAATKTAAAQPAWFDGKTVAAYLTARGIPGVTFVATRFAVAEDGNHYPYHGQTIEGVRLTVTDRAALDSPELGVEIISALHHLYPAQFKLESIRGQMANATTMDALGRGDDPRTIAAGWAAGIAEFRGRRERYLLYP